MKAKKRYGHYFFSEWLITFFYIISNGHESYGPYSSFSGQHLCGASDMQYARMGIELIGTIQIMYNP